MVLRPIHLIWFDAIAGALGGVFMLSCRHWLAACYRLPVELLFWISMVNLAYASVSFTLAMRSRSGRVPGLRVIAVANMAWLFCCVELALVWHQEASGLGLAHLLGEGVFVGGLGWIEWRAARRFQM